MSYKNWDLSALEARWRVRRGRVSEAVRRIDTSAMTRFGRDPFERRWLEQNGGAGPFTEIGSRNGPKGSVLRRANL